MKAKEIKKVVLTGNDLSLDELIAVARYNCEAELSQDTIKNIEDSRKIIDDIVENEKVIYGVTTGFGEFSKVGISTIKTESHTPTRVKGIEKHLAEAVVKHLSQQLERIVGVAQSIAVR